MLEQIKSSVEEWLDELGFLELLASRYKSENFLFLHFLSTWRKISSTYPRCFTLQFMITWRNLFSTYPRCFTFSFFFNFQTLIKYFSLKPISRILPLKPYIKYFHCEILVLRSLAFSNCGVSLVFGSFFVSGLIFFGRLSWAFFLSLDFLLVSTYKF